MKTTLPLLGVLRARWWLVAGVAAVCVASALLFTAQQPRVYQASASAMVAPAPDLSNAADILRALETLERRTVVATLARIPQTREVREASAEALGLTLEALQTYELEAAVVPGTNVLRITVAGPDGARASDLANTTLRLTAAATRGAYRLFTLEPLEAAVPSRQPSYPSPLRNVAVATVLGLFLGLVAALGAEALWPSHPSAARAAA